MAVKNACLDFPHSSVLHIDQHWRHLNTNKDAYLGISGLLGDKTVEYFLPLGREIKTYKKEDI